MLTPEQVIPFLTHDEPFVRRHAAMYLADAHDPSPATADDLWHAMDRHGMSGPEALVSYLRQFLQTEDSLWRAMAALGRTQDERTRDDLEAAVESAPLPLLTQFKDELLAGLQLSDDSKAYLRRRIGLSQRPVHDLWVELMDLGRDRGDNKGPDEEAAELLVQAIGARADDAVLAKAIAILRDEKVIDWREIFAVDVLGESRHVAATDLLLEKLRVDDDAMPERTSDALVRIGTPEVVEKLVAMLPAEEWHVRLYGIDVLGRIKRPESEAALLRMLKGEKDKELRTLIGENLCLLAPPLDVLGMLRDEVAVGHIGDPMHDVEGLILAAGRMVGYAPPEEKKWAERSRQMDERMEQMREEWEREELDPIHEVEGPTEPGFVPGLDPEVTWPIHREAEKVGRNDPCPCGSGKKYKKCCGKD